MCVCVFFSNREDGAHTFYDALFFLYISILESLPSCTFLTLSLTRYYTFRAANPSYGILFAPFSLSLSFFRISLCYVLRIYIRVSFFVHISRDRKNFSTFSVLLFFMIFLYFRALKHQRYIYTAVHYKLNPNAWIYIWLSSFLLTYIIMPSSEK